MRLTPLNELFPDVDYGFSMKMRPFPLAEFFRASPENEQVMRERRSWLRADPLNYAGAKTEDCDVMNDTWAWASACGFLSESRKGVPSSAIEKVIGLGCQWEPDFMVLSPAENGEFVLQAGCVCFPSSWALNEKIGKPLAQIHAVVPGLNERIAHHINAFLTKMKPGSGWLRANWGISSSCERNQHPSREVNQMSATTDPGTLWIRIEHQLLARLEGSCAILFGIRLENVAMCHARNDDRIRHGLRRALSTMPGEMLRYKNLEAIRPSLIDHLS